MGVSGIPARFIDGLEGGHELLRQARQVAQDAFLEGTEAPECLPPRTGGAKTGGSLG